MMQLDSLIQFLDSLLSPATYSDAALNGLQVESSNSLIKTVCVAVDSGLSVIEEALQQSADLLIVHHGLFWGETQHPISGVFGRKIELLLKNGCSLYASHLPLDGNSEVGNAYELGKFLKLEELKGFCEYSGSQIGARGKFREATSMDFIVDQLSQIPGAISPLVLNFGPDRIEHVGIVTGSGSMAIPLCAAESLDLLISGEAKQEAYHNARELQVNALFAGHYATETFGVRALARRIEQQFDLETFFINQPTGI